jgi:sugar porter (SP) family MFS transporter
MYYVLEKFGRRKPIIVGSAFIIIGAVIKGASQNYAMWTWVPIIQGIGTSMVAVSSPPYITECAYPTHRAKAVSLYSCTWQLGALLAAGMNYALLKVQSTWGWRITVICQAVPSLIQLLLGCFAPESPRWLIYHGKSKEAFEMLVKYHAEGDHNSRLVHFEMAEITASLMAEKEMHASKWSEWTSTKGNRHRLAINIFIPVSLQFAGNALISYYLPIVLKTVNIVAPNPVLGINLGLASWSVIAGLFAAFVVDRAGRRILLTSGYALMFVAFLILTIASGIDAKENFQNKNLAGCVVTMIFLYQSFYQLSGATASTYIMEITPFSLRSKASTLYNVCGALPGVYNSFANPPIMDVIGWKYYIVWTCLLAVEFIICFFIVPETKGKGLEEVAEIFDGSDVIAGVNAMKKFGMEGRYNVEHLSTAKVNESFTEHVEKA